MYWSPLTVPVQQVSDSIWMRWRAEHEQLRGSAVAFEPDAHVAALGLRLERVEHQVERELPQRFGVQAHQQRPGGELALERDRARAELVLEHVQRGTDGRGEIAAP